MARQDALWHGRVRPANTSGTSLRFLTLPGKEGQSPLNPKVQGSTPCASTNLCQEMPQRDRTCHLMRTAVINSVRVAQRNQPVSCAKRVKTRQISGWMARSGHRRGSRLRRLLHLPSWSRKFWAAEPSEASAGDSVVAVEWVTDQGSVANSGSPWQLRLGPQLGDQSIRTSK